MRTLLYDSFTDVDDTLLENHTPEIGGPWVMVSGALRCKSNKLQVAAAGVYTVAIPPCERIEVLATLEFLAFDAGKNCIFSVRNADNVVFLESTSTGSGSLNNLIVRPKAATYSLTATQTLAIGAGAQLVRMSFDGSYAALWRAASRLYRFAFEPPTKTATQLRLSMTSPGVADQVLLSDLRILTW